MVHDTYSKKLKIFFEDKVEFQEGDPVEIDSSRMNLIIDRLGKTIKRIRDDDLDENNQKILQFILGNGEPQYNQLNVDFNVENLNTKQKEAITKTLTADCFHLVIGPPGTGKTYVIKEIINQLISKDQKILVTASTNNAVDNILEKFDDCSPETILRIGSLNKIDPKYQKFALEKKREQSDDWQEVKQIEKLIKKQKESKDTLFKNKTIMENQIRGLEEKKESYRDIIDSLLDTKKIYQNKSLKYEPSNYKINSEIINLESELSKLDEESEKYESLAFKLLNLAELAETLPKQEDFYKLEEDLKKLDLRGQLKGLLLFLSLKDIRIILKISKIM